MPCLISRCVADATPVSKAVLDSKEPAKTEQKVSIPVIAGCCGRQWRVKRGTSIDKFRSITRTAPPPPFHQTQAKRMAVGYRCLEPLALSGDLHARTILTEVGSTIPLAFDSTGYLSKSLSTRFKLNRISLLVVVVGVL